MLDAIQELRGAGAETMEIDGVRVGVSTAVTGSRAPDGRRPADHRRRTSSSSSATRRTWRPRLNIPGGVVQDHDQPGRLGRHPPSDRVVVDALRPLDTPQYASPETDD